MPLTRYSQNGGFKNRQLLEQKQQKSWGFSVSKQCPKTEIIIRPTQTVLGTTELMDAIKTHQRDLSEFRGRFGTFVGMKNPAASYGVSSR